MFSRGRINDEKRYPLTFLSIRNKSTNQASRYSKLEKLTFLPWELYQI